MDFMVNKSHLPNSANLQFLYMFYKMVSAGIIMYPLSLVFAVLSTILSLIKKNEIIAFFSVGYSPLRLLLPILSVALLVTSFFLLLQFSSITSFDNKAKLILKGRYLSNVNNDLFFKFNNNIIFIKQLDTVRKVAKDMKIFFIQHGTITKIFAIKKAKFEHNAWKPDSVISYQVNDDDIVIKRLKIDILQGFKPDILGKLESKQAMTLKTAIEAISLLQQENVNINFIKTYIYSAIIPPLSFVGLIILIFLHMPISDRISNVSLFVAVSLFGAVILWGVFLLAKRMSLMGIVSVDIAFLLPFVLIVSALVYTFKRSV